MFSVVQAWNRVIIFSIKSLNQAEPEPLKARHQGEPESLKLEGLMRLLELVQGI